MEAAGSGNKRKRSLSGHETNEGDEANVELGLKLSLSKKLRHSREKRGKPKQDEEKTVASRVTVRPESGSSVSKYFGSEKQSVSSKSTKASLKWVKLTGENLDCDFCLLYPASEADELFRSLEAELTYNTGRTAQVQIYGKWHDIPRRQTAHGDDGLKYSFSGTTVPANTWTPLLLEVRKRVEDASGFKFNFVLINRYKDGSDHIGEHRDDEKDLVQSSPIASLSLGQARDFIFKHGDARGKNRKRDIKPVQICLEHGSLLVMNYPTNVYWYHSVPVRKKVTGPRINMTFRQMVIQ